MRLPEKHRALALHLGVLGLLLALQLVLPPYHHSAMARILVLATYAMGYNVLNGYTGLLSLGHALLFAAGLYGAGLSAEYLGSGPAVSVLLGGVSGAVLAALVGLLALRTTGVSFMIVTMMFAQAGFLTLIYFNTVTKGDQGFVLPEATRQLSFAGVSVPLSDPVLRYNLALALFAAVLLLSLALVRSGVGRVLVAIRENEARAGMLGYDTFRYKLLAMAVSGGISGLAGAFYAELFGYVGAGFADTQYSIYPILWGLLGGMGTTLGPLIGTTLMFYLVDIASGFTSAYMLIVGVVLVLLVLWFPKGILGTLRERLVPWLP